MQTCDTAPRRCVCSSSGRQKKPIQWFHLTAERKAAKLLKTRGAGRSVVPNRGADVRSWRDQRGIRLAARRSELQSFPPGHVTGVISDRPETRGPSQVQWSRSRRSADGFLSPVPLRFLSPSLFCPADISLCSLLGATPMHHQKERPSAGHTSFAPHFILAFSSSPPSL